MKYNTKILLLGSALALAACKHGPKSDDAQKKADAVELVVNAGDKYGNVALFEANRSKIKYGIAFVENLALEAYHCGKKWTISYGVTVLYSADGKSNRDVVKGDKCTKAEAEIYLDRYLTFDVLKCIQKYVTVPMDEKTMLATAQFCFWIGETSFKKSEYLRQLNAGVTGEKLAKYLTRFRFDMGGLKRNYFFAAIMSDKMTFNDLLDLRAEGCYNLYLSDACLCRGKGKTDRKANLIIGKNDCATFDYTKIQANLALAKLPRVSKLGVCQDVKDIVPASVRQELYGTKKNTKVVANNARVENLDEKIKAHDAAIEKYKSGDTIGARDDLLKLTKTNYNCALLQNDIAFMSYKIGEYKMAISSGKNALKLSENAQDSSAAFYNMGIAYEARGNYNDAVKNLQSAVATSSNNTNKKALQRVLDLQSQQIKSRRVFGRNR